MNDNDEKTTAETPGSGAPLPEQSALSKHIEARRAQEKRKSEKPSVEDDV